MKQTRTVLDFFKRDNPKKVLEGIVRVIGGRVTALDTRYTDVSAPLEFEPGLRSATRYNPGCMDALVDFLYTYRPVERRGLVFYPEARYSLSAGDHHLSLSMQEERNWAQGHVIDVIEIRGFDPADIVEVTDLLIQGHGSSFVLGRLTDIEKYLEHILFLRYFAE
ncbi:hypothetical protein JW868_03895 [Candidatus Woesearchaeota archaeon]|nr:hypothetical protein [Candidatus Woesearchaeota archaeon]